MDLSVFSGRKIIAAAITLIVGIGATYFKGDVPPGLLTLLQTLFGAFVLGNSVEHVSNAVLNRSNMNPINILKGEISE